MISMEITIADASMSSNKQEKGGKMKSKMKQMENALNILEGYNNRWATMYQTSTFYKHFLIPSSPLP